MTTENANPRGLLLIAGAMMVAGLMALSFFARPGVGARPEPPAHPRRIVSLAPSTTEILFALGLDREVAGVTDFCAYPPAAASLPRVGGFKGKSLEAIISLSPDLVIGTRDGNEPGLISALQRLGVPVVTVEPATLSGVIESILLIGRAVGHEDRALALNGELISRLNEVKSRVRGSRPVKVLFVYGRNPLVLAGPGTFADDMIRAAGGENVAAGSLIPYPRFSMETVISMAPEVIVEGVMGSEGLGSKQAAARSFWSRWDSLPAVRDGRIALLDEDLIARPGPRIFDGLEQLARALHPDRFEGPFPAGLEGKR